MSSRVHKISNKYTEDCRPVLNRRRARHQRRLVSAITNVKIQREVEREMKRAAEFHRVASSRGRSWHWAHFVVGRYEPLCGASGAVNMKPIEETKLKACEACERKKAEHG